MKYHILRSYIDIEFQRKWDLSILETHRARAVILSRYCHLWWEETVGDRGKKRFTRLIIQSSDLSKKGAGDGRSNGRRS